MKLFQDFLTELEQHDLEHGYTKSEHKGKPTLKFTSDNDAVKFLKHNKNYTFVHRDNTGIHLAQD